MDKRELKGIIWLTILTIILFSLFAFVVWPHTDMYKAEKAYQRQQAISYLQINYWDNQFPDIKQRIMDDFHLTDHDINPVKIFERAKQELSRNGN